MYITVNMLNSKHKFMESFAKDIIVGWQLQSPIDNKLVIIGGNNKQKQFFTDNGFDVEIVKKIDIIRDKQHADDFVKHVYSKTDTVRFVGVLNKEVVFANHTSVYTTIPWITAKFNYYQSAARIMYIFQQLCTQVKDFAMWSTDLFVDVNPQLCVKDSSKFVYMSNGFENVANQHDALQYAYLDKVAKSTSENSAKTLRSVVGYNPNLRRQRDLTDVAILRTHIHNEMQHYEYDRNLHSVLNNITEKHVSYEDYLALQSKSACSLVPESVFGSAIPFKRVFDALYCDSLPIFLTTYDNLAKQSCIEFADFCKDNNLIFYSIREAHDRALLDCSEVLAKFKAYVATNSIINNSKIN